MASVQLSEELTCSICQEIYTDPVTLTCGHNFCLDCINRTWDNQEETESYSQEYQEKQSRSSFFRRLKKFVSPVNTAPLGLEEISPSLGAFSPVSAANTLRSASKLSMLNKNWDNQKEQGYSCPECRQRFRQRPKLKKNLRLNNIAKNFLSIQWSEKEETRIFCTFCTHYTVPAVTSCLHCEASLCDLHLILHSKSPEHVLSEPASSLCSIHKKLLKYYCYEDAACICETCYWAENHRRHRVELLNEAFEKKKEKLRTAQNKLASKREKTERKIQRLQERKREVLGKAAGVTVRVTAPIGDVRKKLESLEMRLKSEIFRWVEQVSFPENGLVQQLKIKDELSRKIGHIDELCSITNPLMLLQEQGSERPEVYGTEEGGGEDTDDTVLPPVNDLDESWILGIVHTGLADVMMSIKRRIFAQEATDILLDINTAGNYVTVSGDIKTAFWSDINQCRPETPVRFQYSQVLSSQTFSSGQHYWDVETSGSGVWRVGVAYPSIGRNDDQSIIGDNNKSWSLRMWDRCYSVRHDGKVVNLYYQPSCQSIRITLDYEAGRLSFYELGDLVRHLHTFTAIFTEPLHAAFWVCGAWVRIRMMASADLREELTCSICQEIYTDPITLTCGHSYCLDCITRTWDRQEERETSCPECRQIFRIRPELKRNLRLHNIVEHFLPTHSEQEETGISPVPAAKLCLLSQACVCGTHLRVHNKSPEHVLNEPTTSWDNKKCSNHKMVLEYYCSEDDICICVYCCLAGEHRGHELQTVKDIVGKKKDELAIILKKMISERKKFENMILSLQGHWKVVQEKAAVVTKQVTDQIRDIRDQLDVLEKRVLSEVSRQVEQISHSVSDQIQQMEKQKKKLSRKISQIEELRNTTDPLSVLQGLKTGRAKFCDQDRLKDDENVTDLGDLDEVLISMTLYNNLVQIVTFIKKKEEFKVQWASDILLDVNTAGDHVHMSGNLQQASWSQINKNYTEKFKHFPQALSTRSFSSGRHYWAVETSKYGCCSIGVAYPSMERRGGQSCIGYNSKSWCLCKGCLKLSVIHNKGEIKLHCSLSCYKLGVYLDYEAGRVSFYELCDPIRHLHTFTATFTEPLHAAFLVDSGWVRICS
ncbi:uncharacterized protein WCC33_015953 [Rhinophrynus dorsalis]